ncbi:unnamed protein product [Ectocarpus sp. CCAP 1310/34]|nr:unnamed protein product [Ectocarpus sp. CCAP 1310/34]
MPQGANASPSWFVKVINRVVHGLERVLAYLDNAFCFDEEPLGHVLNLIEFFKRQRQYNLKLPGKARVGATQVNFLGHTISPAGVSPDGVQVRALTHMPPPPNVKQLRSLLGGLSYYRIFLKNLATKMRPLNSLLKQGVPFKYTPGHGQGWHQSLARDQLEYCNLAVDRQRRAYELVREYNALKISRVERRNSSLLDAIHKLPQFTVGGCAWVYNTAATIRQGVQKDTDQQVLKAKFALSWTGPYKVLAVGPTSADATPDGRSLARKLFYLDLPSGLSGPAARCHVSVLRCKPCRNSYETDDLPQSLPAELSRYVLHSFGDKCPPFHVTVDDVSVPVGRLEVDYISGHQLVRGRSGVLAVLYQTHWVGLTTPS